MPQTLVKVKNYPDLMRDINSGAVINKNITAFETAKKQKDYFLNIKNKLISNENEIIILKDQISGLKNVIEKVLERVNK